MNDSIDGTELVTQRKSGRAVWDDRGNSTWEWQTTPGVFSRDIDTVQLRLLITEDLSIAEDEPPRSGWWP